MIKLINITCIGHSGSTLLAMCLNSHPKISFFGEFSNIQKKIIKTKTETNTTVCSFCVLNNCPLFDKDQIKILNKFYFTKKNKISSFINLFTHYFYIKHFSKITKSKFVGDSSKSPKWYLRNFILYNYIFNSYYIILKRNKFGLVNSLLKKGKNLQEIKSLIESENTNLEKLKRKLKNNKFIQIDYDSLVLNPKETINKILSNLNLEFTDQTLNYRNYNHHFAGGNSGTMSLANKKFFKHRSKNLERYKNINTDFELDNSWKSELNKDQIDFIDSQINNN
jgi:hypothetical protein